jgi:RNA polymerase sigma factor (sigma-70 family)
MLRWARSLDTCAPHEPEDIAQRAWEKFMRAAPEVFERLMGMPAILGYLKRCVRSVFIDQMRKAKSDEKTETLLKREWVQVPSPEKLVLDSIFSEQFAEQVYAQLDEQEFLVFRLTFELDMTPRQIVEQYPHIFPDVHAVYRIKERAFRRLRSNPILKFLYDDL